MLRREEHIVHGKAETMPMTKRSVRRVSVAYVSGCV
jgi:hypothetical protein